MHVCGCVAVGTPLKWEGLGYHSDSCPKSLGIRLWRVIQDRDLKQFTEHLLQFDRLESCWEGGYNYGYQHITNEESNPLFVEWVYIVDSERRMLHVLKSEMLEDEDLSQPRREPVMLPNRAVFYGNCAYKHVLAISIKLDGPEPDWAQIQKGE